MDLPNNVKAWPKATGKPLPPAAPIIRPCDAGLQLVVYDLEAQLGTIEAYNRLTRAAYALRKVIDDGKAKPQNPLFARSVKGDPCP